MSEIAIFTDVQQQNHSQQSPFHEIRGYRANGTEYWTGRELMRWLGYTKWDKFTLIIDQAIENLVLLVGLLELDVILRLVYRLISQQNGYLLLAQVKV